MKKTALSLIALLCGTALLARSPDRAYPGDRPGPEFVLRGRPFPPPPPPPPLPRHHHHEHHERHHHHHHDHRGW